MNTKGLFDQLLRQGQPTLQSKKSPQSAARRSAPGASSPLSGLTQGLGKGALTSGALGMLMGSNRLSKFGGTGLKYGGLAALGMLAYKGYSNWQKQNASTAPAGAPRTIDRVSGSEAEDHSRAVLKALVAAAKADGHIDAREQQLIDEELGKLADDASVRDWLKRELNKPLDPEEVASAAGSLEMASEMYLVSLMMVDEQSYMERAYLRELARHLKLDPALRSNLEAQARQGA
jgi:uncharacterized membrane protein YebE (DUF533 family)